MKSAGFGAPGVKGAIDQPRGHDKDGKAFEPGPNADNPAAIGPAGTVHCSISDWAKFVALHVRGERENGGKRVLEPESFLRLHTPTSNDSHYAMGWLVVSRPWAAGRALTHSGSNTMWFCTTWLAPDRDFAVLVTCNQGGDEASKACDAACGALIQDHVGRSSDAK
jgi:CubicO group peptidase (beta-lactamase class C family)